MRNKNGEFLRTSAEIVRVEKAAEDIFLMELRQKRVAALSRPGQFAHIFCGGETVLRRPFSIFSKTKNSIQIFFKKVGAGTKILSTKKEGAKIDLIAPLGNGFPTSGGMPLFVAGGVGAAPLHFLALSLKRRGIFIYGTKRKNEMLPLDDIRKAGHNVVEVCEETGEGKVTDIIQRYLPGCDMVFASGPVKMLKKTAEICLKNNKKSFFSMEERMGCGIGLCQTCVIKTTNGYRKVCVDGPVFSGEEIEWGKIR